MKSDRSQPAPEDLTDLPRASFVKVLRGAVGQIKGDELTDRAGALTYYGVQAIFPGLLVLVPILGLLGQSTTKTLVDNLGQMGPGSANSYLQTIITNAQSQKSLAALAGVFGLALARWSASGYGFSVSVRRRPGHQEARTSPHPAG